MGTQKSYLFELADTTALTAANTGALSINKGTGSLATASADFAHSGTTSAKFVPASSQGSTASLGLAATDMSAAISFYAYLTANPTADTRICDYVNSTGSGDYGRIMVNSTGKLMFQTSQGGISTRFTSTGTLPLNAWIRIESWTTVATSTTGVIHLAAYLGDSTTAITNTTYDSTNNNLGTVAAGRFVVGRSNGVAAVWTIYIDDVRIEEGRTSEIGPYVSSVAHVLAGSAASTSTTSGDQALTQPFAGGAASTSSTAGAVTMAGALTGSAASTSATAGAVTATARLAGSAASTSTTGGAVTATVTLIGSAASVSTATGTIGTALTLTGAATSASSTGGTITRTMPLTGSAASTSTTTGQLGASAWTLTGSATSTSTTSGAVTAARALTGAAASVSTTTGSVTATQPLTGTATSASTTSGTLVLAYTITGTAESITTTTGELWAALTLDGTALSVSTTSGAITDTAGLPYRDVTVTITGPFHFPTGLSGPLHFPVGLDGPHHFPTTITGPLEMVE